MHCETITLYEDRADVTLTTYVLDDSPELLDGQPRGAVLICPGGAYLMCSDREGEPVAMAFAAMGYHAFVLRYSVYHPEPSDSWLTQSLAPKQECQFPQPMRDIGRAMVTIQAHADQWHVDTGKIALCGFSAGAHNCAMYAVSWDKPDIAGHLGVDASLLRPAACVLGYTLSDYVYMKQVASAADPEALALFRASNTALLGVPDPGADLLARVSPARLVDDSTPPMYLWATSADALVPVQHTLLMAQGLADHAIPFEVHVFEDGPHGLSLATPASAGVVGEIDPDAAHWVPLCAAWLYKRLAVSLPSSRSQ